MSPLQGSNTSSCHFFYNPVTPSGLKSQFIPVPISILLSTEPVGFRYGIEDISAFAVFANDSALSWVALIM